MKPLDLSKPVQTRDGRPARIVSTNMWGDYPIGAIITETCGKEHFETHTADGAVFTDEDSNGDLQNISERKTKTFWANFYDKDGPVVYNSVSDALGRRLPEATTVKVTVEYVKGVDQL